MADTNRTAAPEAADSPTGAAPIAHGHVVDARDLIEKARDLGALGLWIARTRGVCDQIRFWADTRPALAAELKACGIRPYMTEWDSKEDTALECMYVIQDNLLSDAEDVLRALHGRDPVPGEESAD